MYFKNKLIISSLFMTFLLIGCAQKSPTIIVKSSAPESNVSDNDEFSYQSPGSLTSVEPGANIILKTSLM